MNINLTFKNFEPSEHLKKYAKKRFEKIVKYIGQNSDSSEVMVAMTVEKFRHKAEVTFVGDYAHISAVEESEDMYSTIDLVLDKLEAQIRKLREKNKDKRRGSVDKSVRMDFISYSEADGKRESTITARDHYEPKPMSVDEAAEQLENLKYEFLVFRNSENERVNVIYRRKNNDFGLIDPGT